MASSEQSSGAWRILKGIFTVLAVLVVLAALAVVGYESWRQQDIRKAKAEQEAAIAEVKAHFSDVEDWPAWWRGRVDGTWGGDEFHKWAEAANADDDLRMDCDLAEALERQLAGTADEFDRVKKSEVIAFLERTSAYPRESEQFLQYDHLSGVPILDEDGMIVPAAWLDSTTAMNMLHERVYALIWLERYDEAWDELQLLHGLTTRFNASYCVLEHLLNAAQYENFATTLELVAARSSPPEALSAEFSLPEATLDKTHVIEGELAYHVGLFGLEGDLTSEEWRYDDEDWFSWFTPDGWESTFGDSNSAAEIYRYGAGMYLSALELYEAARDEREPQGLEENYEDLFLSFDESNARRNIYRQRANLVVALRVFEAEGNPLSEFEFDAEKYPDLTLRHTGDGAEIQFADTERVRLALNMEDLALDMEDADFKSATLPPLNGE